MKETATENSGGSMEDFFKCIGWAPEPGQDKDYAVPDGESKRIYWETNKADDATMFYVYINGVKIANFHIHDGTVTIHADNATVTNINIERNGKDDNIATYNITTQPWAKINADRRAAMKKAQVRVKEDMKHFTCQHGHRTNTEEPTFTGQCPNFTTDSTKRGGSRHGCTQGHTPAGECSQCYTKPQAVA